MSKINNKYKTGCRIKAVFVGDGAVGKTCILVSYTSGQFPKDYVPTVFDNHTCSMVVDGLMINLELWDTAGQEGYSRIRPLAYNTADVFVIVFDVTNKDSLENVKKLWAPELRSHCKEVPIVVVATKTDLRKDSKKCNEVVSNGGKILQPSDGEAMAAEIKAKLYLECSALTQEGLPELFEKAVRVVIERSDDDEEKNTSCAECVAQVVRSCEIL